MRGRWGVADGWSRKQRRDFERGSVVEVVVVKVVGGEEEEEEKAQSRGGKGGKG